MGPVPGQTSVAVFLGEVLARFLSSEALSLVALSVFAGLTYVIGAEAPGLVLMLPI